MSAHEVPNPTSRLARFVMRPYRTRQAVTHREAIAAARARVAADKLRGAQTPEKILTLANEKAD